MYGNLHGYLPTKCEPGNVAVDFEMVPTIPLKQSMLGLFIPAKSYLFINFAISGPHLVIYTSRKYYRFNIK